MAVPRIEVLGDVRVDVTGIRPGAWRRAREVIVYLALFPGLSESAFTAALFGEGRPRSPELTKQRNEKMRLARRWAGEDEHGRSWIPEVKNGVYTINEVDLDWDTFTALVGDRASSRTTQELVDALELVKGRPLSGIEDDLWDWAQPLKTRMCRKIADVVHELVDRAMADQDTLLALWAVEVGVQCVPESSRMWDRAITVAAASGGRSEANAMARRRQRWLET